MKFRHLLARGAVAIALAASIGAVCAAESATTEILLLGKDQKREKLKFEGELPIGQSRGLYTDAGTPVTVFRTEKGLRVETPERTVDVPYLDHAAIADGEHRIDVDAGADGKRRVVILHNEHHTDGDAAHAAAHDKLMKRVIVLGDGADVKVMKLDELDRLGELPELAGLAELKHLDRLEGLEALDALDAKVDVDVDVDVEGDRKVIVVRKIRKQDAQVD